MREVHAGGSPSPHDLQHLDERRRLLDERMQAGRIAAGDMPALKADIIALYKDVEAAVAAHARLRDQVRELAAQWKTVGVPSTATPATTRVDHLGASTYIEKGWSRLSTGDAPGAEQALRRALELAPDNNEAGALLAWSFVHQEKVDAARLLLQRVQASDEQHALAMVVSGWLEIRTGNIAVATDLLLRAVAHSTFDRRALLYAHLYLGMAQRQSGNSHDAAESLRSALALGPNFLEAAYELGQTLLQVGDTTAAIDTWRAAASANKFSPWGKRCAEMVVLHERGESPVAV